MFGKETRLSPIEARKQLLIAESEINRLRLLEEWQALSDELGRLAERARSFDSMSSLITPLLAGLTSFSNNKPADEAPKRSWFRNIVVGARLTSTIWRALRRRGSDAKAAAKAEAPERHQH
jgi:hypothetical protein